MGDFSFIPKKKVCPIDAVKILEYTRSSVSVPKPFFVFVHIRTYELTRVRGLLQYRGPRTSTPLPPLTV